MWGRGIGHGAYLHRPYWDPQHIKYSKDFFMSSQKEELQLEL